MIKKKIAVFHSSNDLYGASKIMLQVVDILIKEGYEIHVFLPYNGPLNEILEVKKIKLNILNFGVLRRKYFNFFGIINRIFKITSSTRIINKYLWSHKIDLVYTSTSIILAGAISAKLNKIPNYFHIHEIPNNKIYLKIMGSIVSYLCSKVIVVSKSVEDHWKKYLKNTSISLIYNGINFKSNRIDVSIKSNDFKILTVARLIPYKGHIYLINLARKLLIKHPNLMFLIIGDTFKGYEDYEKKLKTLANDYGLNDNVIFKGFKNDVSKYLESSSFLLHPSIDPDPLPTVLFEAVNSLLPIIATNHGGAVEILDNGKGGLLIPYDNLDLAVNLIEGYISNLDLQKEKKEYAYTYMVSNFSEKKFKENIIKLFKS
jgi:glycosyltransferase involved in cell wall biosynthesis